MRILRISGGLLSLLALCEAVPPLAPAPGLRPGAALIRRAFHDDRYWEQAKRAAQDATYQGHNGRRPAPRGQPSSVAEWEVKAVEVAQQNEQKVAREIWKCWTKFLDEDVWWFDMVHGNFRSCVQYWENWRGVVPSYTPQMEARLQLDVNRDAMRCVLRGRSKWRCIRENTIAVNGKTLVPELGSNMEVGRIPAVLNTAYKGAQNQFTKAVQNPDAVAAWASQNMKSAANHIATLGPTLWKNVPKRPVVGKAPIVA